MLKISVCVFDIGDFKRHRMHQTRESNFLELRSCQTILEIFWFHERSNDPMLFMGMVYISSPWSCCLFHPSASIFNCFIAPLHSGSRLNLAGIFTVTQSLGGFLQMTSRPSIPSFQRFLGNCQRFLGTPMTMFV